MLDPFPVSPLQIPNPLPLPFAFKRMLHCTPTHIHLTPLASLYSRVTSLQSNMVSPSHWCQIRAIFCYISNRSHEPTPVYSLVMTISLLLVLPSYVHVCEINFIYLIEILILILHVSFTVTHKSQNSAHVKSNWIKFLSPYFPSSNNYKFQRQMFSNYWSILI